MGSLAIVITLGRKKHNYRCQGLHSHSKARERNQKTTYDFVELKMIMYLLVGSYPPSASTWLKHLKTSVRV